MGTNIAIKVQNLGKRYRIGERESYRTFRDAFSGAVSEPLHRLRKRRNEDEYFWALKDVSFEVEQGEVVGIIGRNGSGKSTLLKILSRITAPTEGQVELYGRVGSLLEVGTGFHSELTGRENIYLSGSILGMKKQEIDEKFDEIVRFSEIEGFLDTPVKRYSSGMYVRLAFAVAANLNPEILFIDEVLAVGDIAFQKKCLGKMGDVAKEGRTILFVSHNMAAVQNLCNYGILLDKGKVICSGEVKDVIAEYVKDVFFINHSSLSDRSDRVGNQLLKFTKVEVSDSNGNKINQVISGESIYFRIYYESLKSIKEAQVNIAFNVKTELGYTLTNLNSVDSGFETLDIFKEGFFECFWPKFNLKAGSYSCALFCSINGQIADWIQDAFTINVENGDFFGTGKIIDRSQGELLIEHYWKCHEVET
ncbi:MAG: ABC transporter ATP-binding protein [Methanotrichaceae archaeon]